MEQLSQEQLRRLEQMEAQLRHYLSEVREMRLRSGASNTVLVHRGLHDAGVGINNILSDARLMARRAVR